MTDLPNPVNDGQTHWEGCWRHRGHHNCAVMQVKRLRAACLEIASGVYMKPPWDIEQIAVNALYSSPDDNDWRVVPDEGEI